MKYYLLSTLKIAGERKGNYLLVRVIKRVITP